MKKSLIWRFIIILLILGGWGISMFPLQDKPFIEVMRQEAEQTDVEFDKLLDDARQIIDKAEARGVVSPSKVVMDLAKKRNILLRDNIPVYNQPTASNKTVLSFINRKSAAKLRLGIDLQGGTEFIIGFDPDKVPEDRSAKEVRDEIIEILRNRVDSQGVVEPEIKPIGPNAISLKIPSVRADEIKEYQELIEATANLHFHIVHDDNDNLSLEKQNDPALRSPEPDYKWVLMESESRGQFTSEYLLIRRLPEAVNGTHLKSAFASIDEFGTYSVNLQFNLEGANLFFKTTADNVGKRMAIVLDGTVYSAPVIRDAIGGGNAVITGSFTVDEASRLATVLQCGNLPVGITIEGQFFTDPTLGRESVRSGTIAALGGLSLVIIFMVVYYMTAGIIACLALAANILLVLGTLTIAGATITLPGIAGIVLTIGMAVDANVLIFERIREELANKKSVGNAIRTGYERAFVTILDANLTTLLTALILYKFGTGPIRGFAVTLSIGIMASLFTSLFVTRAVFDLLLRANWIKDVKMLRILSKTSFEFLNWRKMAAVASAIILLVSIVVFAARGDSRYSVDFRGGTELTYTYKQEVSTGDIQNVLAEHYADVRASYKFSAQEGTRLLEVVISGEPVKDIELLAAVEAQLNTAFPEARHLKKAKKEIGGLVGEKFKWQAMMAMIWAIIGIVVYITLRFEFGYALGAVAALTHDVVICAGVFLVANFFQRQLSLPVIAALLTILGYSLNDTIVVFDRIRENIGLIKNKKFLDIVNISLNQTLSRTILTSVTTLVVVVILYIFGGGAINDFALVMIIGVFVGTYSSIFVATPVMILFHEWQEGRPGADAVVVSSKAELADIG